MHAPRRSVALGVAAVTILAVSACRNTPGHTAGELSTPTVGATPARTAPSLSPTPSAGPVTPTATPTPSASHRTTPHPTATIHPTLTIRPTVARPDLTIGLARTNACVWFTDIDGEVWVNPLIEAHGTGAVLPSLVSFNMISNYAKHTAGGGLHVNVAQTWAIDIGPSVGLPPLGHVLTLTLTVDPTHEVAESNESNNTSVITIDLTGIGAAPGTGDTPLACH